MLILRNCRMLCTPKAGSRWLTNAVRNAAEHAEPFGEGVKCHHGGLGKGPISLPAIAFVRHPLTWYPSYWNYRVRTGWQPNHDIDECASDDFQSFIAAVVEKFPGWLTVYLQNWIGTAERPADFVGRYENLQDDIQRGLDFYSEPFDKDRLLSTPIANKGDYLNHPAIWTESLKKKVCESESELIEQYYCVASGVDPPATL